MRLEHESLAELKQRLKEIVGRHVDLTKYQLFFFGSRVQDRGDARSDIDVGIEGSESIPPEVKAAIDEAIENLPYLYKIELVDFTTVSDNFYRIAKRSIEPIE
jgi:predicted nucleotidyltransferase